MKHFPPSFLYLIPVRAYAHPRLLRLLPRRHGTKINGNPEGGFEKFSHPFGLFLLVFDLKQPEMVAIFAPIHYIWL
jgi:hypothetical protein